MGREALERASPAAQPRPDLLVAWMSQPAGQRTADSVLSLDSYVARAFGDAGLCGGHLPDVQRGRGPVFLESSCRFDGLLAYIRYLT